MGKLQLIHCKPLQLLLSSYYWTSAATRGYFLAFVVVSSYTMFFFRKKLSWGAAVKIDYYNFKSWRNAPRSNISMAFSVSKRVSTRSIVENCPPKPIPAKLCFKKGLKPFFGEIFIVGLAFLRDFTGELGFFRYSKCSLSFFSSNPYIKNVGWGR